MLTARQLRAARTLAGLSQIQLAEAAGLTARTIRRGEAGDRDARLRRATRARLLAAVAERGVVVDGLTISITTETKG